MADRDRYPRPDADGIVKLAYWLDQDWRTYLDRIELHRSRRFHSSSTPEKEARTLKHETRVYSNWGNREIIDTVAIQTSNPPRVRINPAGSTNKAVERAMKQERWCNQLFSALERQAARAIRRPMVDNQHSSGLGVYEVYLRSGTRYEAIDTYVEERYGSELPEDKVLEKEIDDYLVGATLPFGLRSLDPLSCRWEEDDYGICRAVIMEEKPLRLVFGELAQEDTPGEGIPGMPPNQWGEWVTDTAKTIRYYDRKWMAYIVDEKPVYIREHGMPGVPIFYADGLVTGSPNRSERWQGVTWGTDDLERILDDLITQAVDDAKRYRPRAVITTPQGGLTMEEADGKPKVLRLSDPDEIPQLNPGQETKDLWDGVRPTELSPMITAIQAFMQRSSLNPIATGTSIGADPAGYTVNTLINASQKRYEILLDNEARCDGQVVDFIRLLIRDTIKQKVFLSVPLADRFKGGTEWLGLGPDDVDETPCVVSIDAIGDQNRIATRQSLMQAMGLRVVSKGRVQREGFSIEDPALENFEMAREDMEQQMAPFALQEALRRVYGARTPIGTGAEAGMGPPASDSGTPYQPTGAGAGGGQPAPVEAPTVGTATSAMAGQGNGTGPQAGVSG